jgi:hypothetical protein
MSKIKRRIFAAILLVILIGVPFWDWKLGAVLWMCAWLVFIFQNLYSGRSWKSGENKNQGDEQD